MNDFWALWQPKVAARAADNAAESRMAGEEWQENLIFSETYPYPAGADALTFLSMRWYYRKIRWVNATEDT
jgi:hypothetical protein